MKSKIFDKIFSKNQSNNNDFKSLNRKYEELKKNNIRLQKENIRHKENENKLKNQIDNLLNEKNNSKKIINPSKNFDFTNFQEFLANSYVSPIVYAPFNHHDKRVFGFMDHLSKYLIQNSLKSKKSPLVSILMLTCNDKNIVQKTIDCVLKQSYENWELVIIDNNNLESLKEISNEKIKVLTNENKERASSWNIGLDEAIGEYIMYLDINSEWDFRYVETMIGAFFEIPDADALYSGQLLYKHFNSKPFAVCFGTYNKPLLHNRNYIDISCFCHKKSIYKEIGGFDENLIKLEDWDYILRISNKFKLYSIPVLLSKYFDVDNSNSFLNLIDNFEALSKIIEKNPIPKKEYKKLSHKISIIIPSFESLNDLKQCVESILSFNLGNMVDLIIVDNNSSVEVKDYLMNLKSNQIKLILNDINYGFTYAIQQGISISDKNSDLLLLNNDAILTEGAIEHLQNGAYFYEDCGLIVPHEIVMEKNNHMHYHVPFANDQFKCDITPSKEHNNIINVPLFHDGNLLELNFAPFFCVYIKREIYNKTLGLDSELGRHYRSDRIFSDFVRNILKMKIYLEPNAYVYHKHRSATNFLKKNNEEYNLMFKKNQWPADLAKELGYKKALWDD